ncbi:MAG: AAA family ATPase [Vicinamibacterales bacterium]
MSQPLPGNGSSEDLVAKLSELVIGQPDAVRQIVPYLQTFQAGLSPARRPAGIFLLLGPTGTGKTRTVEALGQLLHGDERALLKIDCGEFQSDHEVAKLIGAPPGYVGHRESKPLLSQARLSAITTEGCPLAIVLFDEIEKAAPALSTLLLGVLDKATLTLGDGSEVNFEDTLVFLTSNLGAREMMKELGPGVGFQPAGTTTDESRVGRLESIGLAAVRKRFSPEFVNRIDAVITYQPLDEAALASIVDQQIVELQRHVHDRLGLSSFTLDVSPAARAVLLARGTSSEYGARELKRAIHRHLTQPLSVLVANRRVAPGSIVRVDANGEDGALSIEPAPLATVTAPASERPTILVVDDNLGLLDWFHDVLGQEGYDVVSSESVEGALARIAQGTPDAAIVDFLLPDGDGLALCRDLRDRVPDLPIIAMTGAMLDAAATTRFEELDIPILAKPFLATDLFGALTSRGIRRGRGAHAQG